MNEAWKPIPGYNGKYEVSNAGNVRSFARKNNMGKLLVPEKRSCGYLFVGLCDGHGNKKAITIHRLVASAFIPNPNNYPQVNHKDENKLNNCTENLEWCTAKYNLAYGTAPKRRAKSRSKPCVGIWEDGTVVYFPSASQAERETGISHSHICCVCNGKYKQAGGAKWRWGSE